MEIQINQKKTNDTRRLGCQLGICIYLYIYIYKLSGPNMELHHVHKILESLEIIFWKLLSPLHNSILYRGIIGFAQKTHLHLTEVVKTTRQVPGAILVLVHKLVFFPLSSVIFLNLLQFIQFILTFSNQP